MHKSIIHKPNLASSIVKASSIMLSRPSPLPFLLSCFFFPAGGVEAHDMAPQLNYHLQGISKVDGSTTVKAPFVTVENILPPQLLDKVRDEVFDYNDDPDECRLRRDGDSDIDCGDERWLDFSLEDARNREPKEVKDVFEQAVAEIAKYDLMHILPEKVASQIKGVSWRIHTRESGLNNAVFHYDSDTGIDYAIDQVPLVHPLLSTVTYLTDYGEPTILYDQSMQMAANPKNNSTTASGTPIDDSLDHLLVPRAAYVVMPAANKHLAFDSRLYHGAGSPIAKYPAKDHWRIIIGTNYHTHHSLESQLAEEGTELDQGGLVAPFPEDEMRYDDDSGVRSTQPWESKDLLAVQDRDQQKYNYWEPFPLPIADYGLDYCQHLAPCSIMVQLPITQMLANEYGNGFGKGGNYGFELTPEDFVVTPDESEEAIRGVKHIVKHNQKKHDDEVSFANEMLKLRCDIFDWELVSMNPPLNADLCGGLVQMTEEEQGTNEGGDDGLNKVGHSLRSAVASS